MQLEEKRNKKSRAATDIWQSGCLEVEVQRKQVSARPETFRPNLTVGLALS